MTKGMRSTPVISDRTIGVLLIAGFAISRGIARDYWGVGFIGLIAVFMALWIGADEASPRWRRVAIQVTKAMLVALAAAAIWASVKS
jgi:uncharacterized protein (DUF983 family)